MNAGGRDKNGQERSGQFAYMTRKHVDAGTRPEVHFRDMHRHGGEVGWHVVYDLPRLKGYYW